METDIKSIHDFDVNLICEYFSNLQRQGPGSDFETLRALSFIDKLESSSLVADIGCGTGTPTLVLARHTNAQIVGIDLYPKFIDRLNADARRLNLQGRVVGKLGDMANLPFCENSLDLIWSEGAVYNIGFGRAMAEWHALLKRGGAVAVSESTWLTDSRPAEIQRFWDDACPQMDTLSNNIRKMTRQGYRPIATFVLPEICWTENFYLPQAKIQERFLQQHRGSLFVKDFVANQRHEFEMYKKYHQYYGYVFYIGRKM